VLSYFLLESEKLGAQVRRYTSPSEHPFSDPALLPKPLLSELQYPVTVKPNQINHNDKVMQFYLSVAFYEHARQTDATGGEGSVHTENANFFASAISGLPCFSFSSGTVLPSICDDGDDENYGSSAMCDVQCLQLLSKR